MPCHRMGHRYICVFSLFCPIFVSHFTGLISAAVVTLDSIEIFRTHEWIPSKPTVYFQCKGENRTDLPDVKDKNVLYAFKGEESWQPLTELRDVKCKRCGIYEKDTFKSDDVFDEWELCASDFTDSDGKYVHFKGKELNATLLCPDCVPLGSASNHSTNPEKKGSNPMRWAVVVVISVVLSVATVVGSVIGYKYWLKRKRQQEQARFLKLFEEDDDIEDELGIGPLSHL